MESGNPPERGHMNSTDVHFNLSGKKALVTGASRGIGAAIALAYADSGADVALLARTTADLEEMADRIRARGGEAHAITCDLTDDRQVAQAVADSVAALGGLDVVVNNAGALGPVAPFLDISADIAADVLDLNFSSAVRVLRTAGSHLVQRGSGVVLNISTGAALNGTPGFSIYAAAKAAMISLTRTLAVEWASTGVRVNALAPGLIATGLTSGMHDDPDLSSRLVGAVPAGRWGTPDDITGAALYLACDASSFVSGTCLSIDGALCAATGGTTFRDLLGLGPASAGD